MKTVYGCFVRAPHTAPFCRICDEKLSPGDGFMSVISKSSRSGNYTFHGKCLKPAAEAALAEEANIEIHQAEHNTIVAYRKLQERKRLEALREKHAPARDRGILNKSIVKEALKTVGVKVSKVYIKGTTTSFLISATKGYANTTEVHFEKDRVIVGDTGKVWDPSTKGWVIPSSTKHISLTDPESFLKIGKAILEHDVVNNNGSLQAFIRDEKRDKLLKEVT